jgi:hypothetical protein
VADRNAAGKRQASLVTGPRPLARQYSYLRRPLTISFVALACLFISMRQTAARFMHTAPTFPHPPEVSLRHHAASQQIVLKSTAHLGIIQFPSCHVFLFVSDLLAFTCSSLRLSASTRQSSPGLLYFQYNILLRIFPCTALQI